MKKYTHEIVNREGTVGFLYNSKTRHVYSLDGTLVNADWGPEGEFFWSLKLLRPIQLENK